MCIKGATDSLATHQHVGEGVGGQAAESTKHFWISKTTAKYEPLRETFFKKCVSASRDVVTQPGHCIILCNICVQYAICMFCCLVLLPDSMFAFRFSHERINKYHKFKLNFNSAACTLVGDTTGAVRRHFMVLHLCGLLFLPFYWIWLQLCFTTGTPKVRVSG